MEANKRYKFDVSEHSGDTTLVFDVLRVDDGIQGASWILPKKEGGEEDLFEDDGVQVAICRTVSSTRTDLNPPEVSVVNTTRYDELFTLIKVGNASWYTTYWPYALEIEEVTA